MSKHVINRENLESHLALSKSPDEENFNVLLGIIKNCDIERSLPWILLMLKDFSRDQRRKFADECNDIVVIHKYITGLCGNAHVSTNYIYTIMSQLKADFKEHEDIYKEAEDYLVLNMFQKTLQELMVEWGFEFMNNYILEIKKKKYESESIK